MLMQGVSAGPLVGAQQSLPPRALHSAPRVVAASRAAPRLNRLAVRADYSQHNHSVNIAAKARHISSARAESSTPFAATVAGECECGETGAADINGVEVDGALLRGLELTDAFGARKRVADVIGAEGKAVVVYLRHLG